MARQNKIAILLLAAGASSRMRGRDKLLEDAKGEPLLTRCARRALQSGADGVLVTLPPNAPGRRNALPANCQIIIVEDAAQGMGRSIAAGANAMEHDTAALMILPADMPDITADDLSNMLTQYRQLPAGHILRATTQDGLPGHPVIFPARDLPALTALTGDAGARQVLAAAKDRLHSYPLPGTHALTDLDTPEAWANWRAQNK